MRQVRIHGLLDADAPDIALLDDVGYLQLSDLVDACTCVESDHRKPPSVGVFARPGNESPGVEDAPDVVFIKEALRLVGVCDQVLLDLGERSHGGRIDGLGLDQLVEEGDQEASMTFKRCRGKLRNI